MRTARTRLSEARSRSSVKSIEFSSRKKAQEAQTSRRLRLLETNHYGPLKLVSPVKVQAALWLRGISRILLLRRSVMFIDPNLTKTMRRSEERDRKSTRLNSSHT